MTDKIIRGPVGAVHETISPDFPSVINKDYSTDWVSVWWIQQSPHLKFFLKEDDAEEETLQREVSE